MRFSRLGVIFTLIYLVVATPLLIASMNSSNVKGNVVFGQLAVAPVMIILSIAHLGDAIVDCPWINNFFSGTIMSLVVVYAIGWTIEAMVRTSKSQNSGSGDPPG